MKAVIDLGSNTFNLLIANIENNELHKIIDLEYPVKIGRGGLVNNIITPQAMQRAMDTLAVFKDYINEYEVNNITALATSAIRNASNAQTLLLLVKNLFNIDITVIDGNKEAEYIYKGALHSFNFPNNEVLVMDIGGGSVEFIIGNKNNIIWKQSFDIGAVRLFEMFNPQNPFNNVDIEAIKTYINKEIAPLKLALQSHTINVLIGTAGSFDTMINVLKASMNEMPLAVSKNAHEISIANFKAFNALMLNCTLNERLCLKGMTEYRAEYIPIATLLIECIIEATDINKIICSNYSLKEGVFFS